MRIVKPWERFLTKVYTNIIDLRLDAITTLGAIANAPSNRLPNFKLKIELANLRKRLRWEEQEPILITMQLLILNLEVFSERRKLIVPKNPTLEMIVENCLTDYRKFNYTIEETDTVFDATSADYWPADWYIVDCVVKDNKEELNSFVEKQTKLIEEEMPSGTTSMISENAMAFTILNDFFSEKENPVQKRILDSQIDVKDESLIEMLRWRKENVANKETIRLIKGLLGMAISARSEKEVCEKQVKELMEEADEIIKKYRRSLQYFEGTMEDLRRENVSLKRFQNNAQNKKENFGRDDTLRLQLQIEELRAENERLKEERDYFADLNDELLEDSLFVHELTSKKYVGEIAYFGLPNKQLELLLAKEGIIAKRFSPVEPKDVELSIPVFFNVSVASHTVWNKIKRFKPYILTGSNYEVLFDKITTKLKGA